jgi:hypothetical protein
VDHAPAPVGVFRRIGYLALFGFLAMFLLAPILTILSLVLSMVLVILAFAFVGFVFWLPFQALGFRFHRGHTWQDELNTGCQYGRKVFALCGTMFLVSLRIGQVACQRCRVVAANFAVFALEMISGALVGLLVVLLLQREASVLTYLAAGGVGALSGFLVVLARRTEKRRELQIED